MKKTIMSLLLLVFVSVATVSASFATTMPDGYHHHHHHHHHHHGGERH